MRYRTGASPVLTLTTGPVDAYPAVLQALSSPVLYDYDPAFQETYQRISEKLHGIVASETVPVILQGEPVIGLEAAAASLIGPDDVVLNLVSGVYGKGFEAWAARSGAEVVELAVAYDRVLDPTAVKAALDARPDVTIVSACHHDTPSGTINPIEAIGDVVAAHGALFLIDAVSSFAGMPIDARTAQADVFVTGPNKCLGCPPGLTILGLSRRAWEKMKANPAAPRASILSLLDWEHAWRAGEPFPFSPSIAEINGLEAAIDLYLAEGPEQVWHRHALTARACRAGIVALGLELWPADERFAAPTATTIRVPEGIEETRLLAELRDRYGVVLSTGRGPLAGKVFRIGHMGPAAQPLHAAAVLAALGGALAALGRPADIGRAVVAAMAVIDADGGD
ncbi:pyridoxamine--pyruvate transaminase [Consotaella aegiceratis]|uniref:pyridoxamine--pyruvate transaminase n=1 Tax=Consotaella aegiceratis TaxID=3097961 RepID=UPI002F3E28EA